MDIKLYSSKSLINNKKNKSKSKSIKNTQNNYLIKKDSIETRNLDKTRNLDDYDNIYLDELELHN